MAAALKIERMPDAAAICVDSYDDGQFAGELYHCYSKEPVMFNDLPQLISAVEGLMNSIHFPQESYKRRSFKHIEPEADALAIDAEKKGLEIEDLKKKQGKIATFLFAVTSRANVSWQGDIYFIEGDECASFSSEIELLKLMANAIENKKLTL